METIGALSPLSPYASGKGRGRAPADGLRARLRHLDGVTAVLQHLRTAPGRRLAVHRRDRGVRQRRCSRGGKPRSTATGGADPATSPSSTTWWPPTWPPRTPTSEPGTVINIGTGKQHHRQRALPGHGRLGRGSKPRRSTPRRAPGDIRDSVAAIDLARQLLGYEPRVDWAGRAGDHGGLVPLRDRLSAAGRGPEPSPRIAAGSVASIFTRPSPLRLGPGGQKRPPRRPPACRFTRSAANLFPLEQ